jgi:hypothetical protein
MGNNFWGRGRYVSRNISKLLLPAVDSHPLALVAVDHGGVGRLDNGRWFFPWLIPIRPSNFSTTHLSLTHLGSVFIPPLVSSSTFSSIYRRLSLPRRGGSVREAPLLFWTSSLPLPASSSASSFAKSSRVVVRSRLFTRVCFHWKFSPLFLGFFLSRNDRESWIWAQDSRWRSFSARRWNTGRLLLLVFVLLRFFFTGGRNLLFSRSITDLDQKRELS